MGLQQIDIPLVDGNTWTPTPEMLKQWAGAYPAVNVERELLAMTAWCVSNPTKRKTFRGVASFCNKWLAKAQDQGGRSGVTAERQQQRELSKEFYWHCWCADRMAEAQMKGVPYEAPGAFRFNLVKLVAKVVEDVFSAKEPDGEETWRTPQSKASAVYGTVHVAIRQGWRWS